MLHRETIRLFYDHMTIDALERHVIEWQGDRCTVDVEDTAFVVWGVRFRDEGQTERFLLHLSDDTREPLVPETLYVRKDNVLYCKVKQGRFPARFHRPAYYQLAQYVEEENGAFFLPLQGQKHPITKKA